MISYTDTSYHFIHLPPLQGTHHLQVGILVAIHLTLLTLLIVLTLIHQALIIVRTAVTSSKIASALLTNLRLHIRLRSWRLFFLFTLGTRVRVCGRWVFALASQSADALVHIASLAAAGIEVARTIG